MKQLLKTCRLLDYSSTDPKTNLAVNETIFRSRHEGLTKDTLHLWQGSNSVIFGGPVSYEEDINHETCRKYGADIVRAISATPCIIYQDSGSLNFAIATNAAFFAKNNQPVLSAYQILNEAIATGLQKFGVKVRADPSGVYVKNKKISEALQKWFHDFLLFQGTLHVDTDINVHNGIIKPKSCLEKKASITSLSQELGGKIRVDSVKEVVLGGMEERLGIKFEKQGLTKDEQKLVEKLYRVKYGFSGWNLYGREPFLVEMGKTAIEVFVAYPPTSKCHELIHLVNDATSDLQGEVKVIIWMRGKGINQHGPYPEMSSSLVDAQKRSIIPAIIINGKLAFSGSVPSKDKLKQAIINEL